MNNRTGLHPSRLFKGSRDDFSAYKFHEFCDNKGETLSIIKTKEGDLFGGYNSNSWSLVESYASSSTNWLFCFPNKLVTQPTQFKLKGSNAKFASYNNSVHMMTFGTGHDLCIHDQCHSFSSNYNDIGKTYENNNMAHVLNGGIRTFAV